MRGSGGNTFEERRVGGEDTKEGTGRRLDSHERCEGNEEAAGEAEREKTPSLSLSLSRLPPPSSFPAITPPHPTAKPLLDRPRASSRSSSILSIATSRSSLTVRRRPSVEPSTTTFSELKANQLGQGVREKGEEGEKGRRRRLVRERMRDVFITLSLPPPNLTPTQSAPSPFSPPRSTNSSAPTVPFFISPSISFSAQPVFLIDPSEFLPPSNTGWNGTAAERTVLGIYTSPSGTGEWIKSEERDLDLSALIFIGNGVSDIFFFH